MSEGRVTVLIGGQYGSEGKGVIAAKLAYDYDVHVRTGSPNAGHSFVHNGHCYKMQTIPCGWINEDATLVIGRGAVFNPIILADEIELIARSTGENVIPRLVVDPLAGVLHPSFAAIEGHTEGEIHARIGSTGEGVGEARRARMMRDPLVFQLAKDYTGPGEGLVRSLCNISIDTPRLLANKLDNGARVLLEGTQGSGLSLIHGQWPYVTSADTNAAQFLADAGIPLTRDIDVLMVLRTYPIRVAGNSGPLYGEVDWDFVANKSGRKLGTLSESTTVSKKIRRVGLWDWEMVHKAMTINRPTRIALNFVDYLNVDDAGITKYDELSLNSRLIIEDIELVLRKKFSFLGTGRAKKARYGHSEEKQSYYNWEVIQR